MPSVPTLTDGTVTLRAHRPEDAHRCWEQCQDPDSQRWTTVPIPYSHEDARRFVTEVMPAGWETNEEWGFAVEHDGRYGGTISLRNRGDGRAEVAYGSHPAVRGRAVMERAVRLLLSWGFAALELESVVWWANRGNWASRKLAHRVGFSFDGTVRRWLPHRGELVDGWVGTLLRGEPLQPRSAWLDCPRLERDGVVLRPLLDADLPRLVEGAADEVTQHWLAFLPHPFGRAEGERWLEVARERQATAEAVNWAVTDAGEELLGVMGLFRLQLGRQAELGYWLHPDGRGRGLAGRGGRLALDHAFGSMGLRRVVANASAPNTASLRVLDGLGLRRTGLGRRAALTRTGEEVDLVSYDLLSEEWEARWTSADHSSTATPTTESAAPTSAGER